MSEYEATLREHERTIDELRKDRDDWRELCQKALDQIDQWKLICERWESRYNEMIARNN
jgi:hypothetical protein